MVIGVTGGMGCGKSTVSILLSQKLNAPIVDADKISHEVLATKEIIIKICNFLGNDILDDKGNIDKVKVANIVFLDISKLKQLNALIHPHVMEKIRERIKLLSEKYQYIIVDVPLPNDDFISLSDYIITVWAELETRIERLKIRSGFSREAVMKRISKQMSQEEYEAFADSVVYNNASIEDLKDALDEIIKNKM